MLQFRISFVVFALLVTQFVAPGFGMDAPSLEIILEVEDQVSVEEPFVVRILNVSDKVVRIKHPDSKAGYNELTFIFSEQGKPPLCIKRKSISEFSWKQLYISPGKGLDDAIELQPGDEFQVGITLGESLWDREWQGIPAPNTGRQHALTAVYESVNHAGKDFWIGKISGESKSKVKLTSSRIRTIEQLANHDYWERVIELLEDSSDEIDSREGSEPTLLHKAARSSNVKIVKSLIELGADLNLKSYGGRRPIHSATDREIIRFIAGKDPKQLDKGTSTWNPMQQAARSLSRANSEKEKKELRDVIATYRELGCELDFYTALQIGDFDRVKSLLTQSPELAKLKLPYESPLSVAAKQGHVKICRYLIENFDVDVDEFDSGHGYPVVMYALSHPEVVQLLIEHGADLDTRIEWTGGRSGFWVLDGDATLLHHATDAKDPKTLDLVLDSKIDIFAQARRNEEKEPTLMALEYAAIFGHCTNALAILNHPRFSKANNDLQKESVSKALQQIPFASWFEKPEPSRVDFLVSLLRKAKQLGLDVPSKSLVEQATSRLPTENPECDEQIKQLVAVLVEHGAEIDFHSAIAIGDYQAVKDVLRKTEDCANLRREDGLHPLDICIELNEHEIARLLLENGADVAMLAEDDYSFLHTATIYNRIKIARHLIDFGTDVNAKTASGNTPLHLVSAGFGNIQLVQLFLNSDADPFALNADRSKPLDVAKDPYIRMLLKQATME
ncbi:MAG: ankyrin repeat domain-containing protein [Mariniblastus sp.]